jgi:NIPSNAP
MANDRTFELRTYRSSPGNLEALSNRFKDHTIGLFAEHGINVTGFWIDPDEDDPTTGGLIYIVDFPSREAAATSWAAFQADERWKAVRAASEVPNGPLTVTVESRYMSPTEYSPIR